MSMTGNIDRVEVITSVQRRGRWSAEEGADRAGALRAGNVGVAGGAAARGRAEPGIHLASALRRGSAVGDRVGEEVVAASLGVVAPAAMSGSVIFARDNTRRTLNLTLEGT